MSNWVFLSFWLALGAGLMIFVIASLEGWRLWWGRRQKQDEQLVLRFVPD